MAIELPIMVYGNGDLYRELFNAIATTLNDKGGYSALIKISLCLSGTWAIIRYSTERNLMALVKWLFAYYLAFYVVFTPIATVEIIDQVNQGKAYTVDHVPLGLAAIANVTTTIGAGLTTLTEKNFSLPDDLKYSQTGLVMAARVVLASTQFQVTDANFQQSLQSFVHQCVFYDLLLNKYSWNDLLTTPNLWQFLQEHASKARAFVYYQPGNSQIVTCEQGAQSNQYLGKDWQAAIQSAATRYGARLFPGAKDPKAQLLKYLPDSYSFLTNISDQGAAILQQNMMANAIQNGIAQMSASTNAPAALEDYAFEKAQQQKRLTNITVGDMAAYWLPIMKNALEATLYGAFIFVFPLLLFPFGASVFKNYIGSLMWLQMWAPLYAILNLFMTYYAQSHSLGALNLGDGTSGLTLSTQSGLAQVNADVAGLAAYLSLSVPLLAYGIGRGMMSAVSQAAQYMAGVTQSAAAGTAGEAVAGNLGMGNTNFSNHTSLNTSANHFDTMAKVWSGGYTGQTAGGSTISLTPAGSLVMSNQGGISQLGTSVHLSQAIRESASQQADQSYTSALSHANSYATSLASSFRTLHDLSHHAGTSASSGETASVSFSGGVSSALNNLDQLTDKFAKEHSMSHSTAYNFLLSAYASMKAGFHLSSGFDLLGNGATKSIDGEIGGKTEINRNSTRDERHLFSTAQDFIHNTNFSKNVDTAIRGLQEHRYSANNEQGQREMDGISSSLDQAAQARQEASSSFQQADSYRQLASYSEEHGITIDSNVNQPFFNWLLEKKGFSAGHISDMTANHPEIAHTYAKEFSDEYVEKYEKDFQRHPDSSEISAEAAFNRNNHKISGNAAVDIDNEHSNAQVREEVEKAGLQKSIVSHQSEKDAQALLSGSQYAVTTAPHVLTDGSQPLKESVNKEVKD